MIASQRLPRISRFLAALIVAVPATARGQDRRDEQFYYPGSFNWSFLSTYPEAARLFNAFDYGHAVLYERLYTTKTGIDGRLEKEYQFLTTDLLVRPPRFAVAEEVIEPAYAKIAWQAKQMFDWAHLLHRQIYDIYADERLGKVEKDTLIEKVTDYYLSRKDVAFTDVPKSMSLMDEQYFSQTFRKAHPKFNGLIWAYHWLQIGLYEPLILGKTITEKKSGVKAALARFWSMLDDPPSHFPKIMPMTATVAPSFTAKHPRAAVIFDNLHMMHDIISDVLAADTIPKTRKRTVIYEQLAEFRDGTRNVLSMNEWRDMGDMMGGVGVMGGPATGLLKGPTADSGMAGMLHGIKGPNKPSADTTMPGMLHESVKYQTSGDTAPPMAMADTAKHQQAPGRPSDDDEMIAAMMALHERMIADPVIRKRVMADTNMRRLMMKISDQAPLEHGRHMDAMMKAAIATGAPRAVTKKSTTARPKPRFTPQKPAHQHVHPPTDTTSRQPR